MPNLIRESSDTNSSTQSTQHSSFFSSHLEFIVAALSHSLLLVTALSQLSLLVTALSPHSCFPHPLHRYPHSLMAPSHNTTVLCFGPEQLSVRARLDFNSTWWWTSVFRWPPCLPFFLHLHSMPTTAKKPTTKASSKANGAATRSHVATHPTWVDMIKVRLHFLSWLFLSDL